MIIQDACWKDGLQRQIRVKRRALPVLYHINTLNSNNDSSIIEISSMFKKCNNNITKRER